MQRHMCSQQIHWMGCPFSFHVITMTMSWSCGIFICIFKSFFFYSYWDMHMKIVSAQSILTKISMSSILWISMVVSNYRLFVMEQECCNLCWSRGHCTFNGNYWCQLLQISWNWYVILDKSYVLKTENFHLGFSTCYLHCIDKPWVFPKSDRNIY